MATLFHSVSVWSDGSLREFVVPEPQPDPSDNLYRIRDDNTSGYTGGVPRVVVRFDGSIMASPPMMVPAYATTSQTSGTHRTPMDEYGWDDYLRWLNGDKFEAAIGVALAMFNSSGWPQMESVFFGCNLIQAAQSDRYGWARLITLDYCSGPPVPYKCYTEDPIGVHKFTVISPNGVVRSRVPALYYPAVSKYPVFMPWSFLEKVSPNMVTQPPP